MKRTLALGLILSLTALTPCALPQSPAQGLRMLAVPTEAEVLRLRTRIQAGESFDQLARRYSHDPSAAAGGYLGTLNTTDLRKEFQDALHGLYPGEISPVIKIDGTFFLLQLLTDKETRWQTRMDAANQALQHGQFVEAEQLIQEAIREGEGFGPQDLRLASSVKALATLSWARGNYAQAAALYERVVAIQEKVLNPAEPELAASFGSLAAIYREQHDYTHAEPLYARALEIREKALSVTEHPPEPELVQLAEMTRQFAELYEEQENFERAEPLYQRALDLLTRAKGSKDPDVANSMINLAELLLKMGRNQEAEQWKARAESIRTGQ